MEMTRAALTFLLVAAVAPHGAAPAAELTPASRELRADLRTVERSIDRSFGDTRMVLIGSTRGGYLQGFGAVFTLEVNVVPMANVSPFKPSYTEQELRQLNQRKRGRIPELEELAAGILVTEAGKLGAIPEGENIALIISLFHFTWEYAGDLPAQVVIQAPRRTLLDRQADRINEQELTKRLMVRRF
jgi:hypothetical protein